MTPSQYNHAVKRLPCSTCNAEPGEPCLTKAGNVTTHHTSRRVAYAQSIAPKAPPAPHPSTPYTPFRTDRCRTGKLGDTAEVPEELT